MYPRTVGIILVGVAAVSSLGIEAATHPSAPNNFQKYRGILEKNIFNRTRGAAAEEKRAQQEPKPVPGAEPTNIKVVGIVKRDDSSLSIAIIEEGGRQRLCRIGETVGAAVITDIRRDEIVLETPGGRRSAQIQPGAMSRRFVMPPSAGAVADAASRRRSPTLSAGGRLPIKVAQIPYLVKSAGLVDDARGGRVYGLRLTRDFMGMKEGDRVTHVGGQSLCTSQPRQKLWQIARKYGGYGKNMPEIPIIVERAGMKLGFVLVPVQG